MKTYRLPLLLIIFAFAFASSALAQSLFVTARYSNDVAVIDTSTNQVVTQIPVGTFPIRIAMTPNQLKAFVSNATIRKHLGSRHGGAHDHCHHPGEQGTRRERYHAGWWTSFRRASSVAIASV